MDYEPIVRYCVERLVEDPDKVQITSTPHRHVISVDVHVAPDDVGKVIGRNGRVINTLRQVVSLVAAKHRHRVFVKVIGR